MEQTDTSLKGPFALIFRGNGPPQVFLFPLKPQHWDVSEPARVTVHQTLEDNFVDDFSGARSVLARVNLRGTFGYSTFAGGLGGPLPGSQHLLVLERLIETFNALDRAVKQRVQAKQEFLALMRLHRWRILIDNFRFRMTNRDPLLYYWELSFLRIQDYMQRGGEAAAAELAAVTGAELGDLF